MEKMAQDILILAKAFSIDKYIEYCHWYIAKLGKLIKLGKLYPNSDETIINIIDRTNSQSSNSDSDVNSRMKLKKNRNSSYLLTLESSIYIMHEKLKFVLCLDLRSSSFSNYESMSSWDIAKTTVLNVFSCLTSLLNNNEIKNVFVTLIAQLPEFDETFLLLSIELTEPLGIETINYIQSQFDFVEVIISFIDLNRTSSPSLLM